MSENVLATYAHAPAYLQGPSLKPLYVGVLQGEFSHDILWRCDHGHTRDSDGEDSALACAQAELQRWAR